MKFEVVTASICDKLLIKKGYSRIGTIVKNVTAYPNNSIGV
jgi:hypothetical protein